MDGIGWEWIALGIAALLAAFIAGRLTGGGGDGRTDLSGPPAASLRPPIASPPAADPAAMASVPLLSGLAPEQRQAIARAITGGNKIQAIKLLREATGLGLKESKDAIEEMERGAR